jgi:hypothetical protein
VQSQLARLFSKYIQIQAGNSLFFYKQNIEWDLLQKGDSLYESLLSEWAFDPILRRHEVVPILENAGMIPRDHDKHITRLQNQIEQDQVALYEEYDNPIARDKHRAAIQRSRNSIIKINNSIQSLDIYTVEFLAEQAKEIYILEHSLYSERKKRIKNLPHEVVIKLSHKLNKLFSSPRELAKSQEFRHVWSAEKSRAFRYRPLSAWQLSVVMFANMYNNIYKNPKKPSAEIIADDDALDGWIHVQNSGDDSQPQQKRISGAVAQRKNVFVVVDNQEQADRVYMSNSQDARGQQKAQINRLEKMGVTGYAKR